MAEDRLPISNLAIHDDDANNSREISQKPRIYGVSAIENEVREEALRAELQGIQQVNSVIEDVLSSLKKANEKMTVSFTTVDNANKLSNLWCRILSQTEHTQQLLLSERWEGASKDLADIKAETLAKKEAAERRAAELHERAVAKERESEAAEARRLANESKPTRGGARKRPASWRGKPSVSAPRGSSVGVGTNSSTRGSSSISKPTRTGIGRGSYAAPRGRGRGAEN